MICEIPTLTNFDTYGHFINYCIINNIKLNKNKRKQALLFYNINS